MAKTKLRAGLRMLVSTSELEECYTMEMRYEF